MSRRQSQSEETLMNGVTNTSKRRSTSINSNNSSRNTLNLSSLDPQRQIEVVDIIAKLEKQLLELKVIRNFTLSLFIAL